MLALAVTWAVLVGGEGDDPEIASLDITVRVGSDDRVLPVDALGINGARLTMSAGCWLDPEAATQARDLGPRTLRIFGGTTANYWDWRSGLFVSAGAGDRRREHNESQPPVRLEDWAIFSRKAGATPIFNLNVMTSSLPEQLAMLDRARELGMPVRYVELGNEFYFNLPDHREAFPTARAYARLANRWAAAIRERFPGVRIAAVGASSARNVERETPERRLNWNQELSDTLSESVDAVTMHVYWPTDVSSSAEGGASPAVAGALSRWQAVSSDIARIPPRFDVWLTEWNLHDLGGPAAGTWDQALGVAVFGTELLRSPRIRLSTFHSLFGENGFAALVEGEPGSRRRGSLCGRVLTGAADLELSPAGAVLRQLFALAGPGTRVRPISFRERSGESPDEEAGATPDAVPGLSGNLYESDSTVAVLTNATGRGIRLRLPEFLAGGLAVLTSGPLHAVRARDLESVRSSYGDEVILPPYSVAALHVGEDR